MSTQETLIASDQLAVTALDAARLLGISRAQFFKLHSAGKTPMPVRLGSRAPRWLMVELREWLAAGCPDRVSWERSKRGDQP